MNSKSFKLLCTVLIVLLLVAVSYALYKTYIHNQDVHNYFLSTKAKKEELDFQTIKNLKVIIEDPNINKESRQEAVTKLVEIANNMVLEKKIEERLYPYFKDEVVCFIEGNRCRIIVHSTKLGASKTKLIKSIVYEAAHINEVEIALKN